METKTDMGEVARQTIAAEQDAAKAAEELKKLLDTPIGQDEARLRLADIDMKEAQMLLLREQVLGQINQVDQQLAACRCARAEVMRRLANPPETDGGEGK